METDLTVNVTVAEGCQWVCLVSRDGLCGTAGVFLLGFGCCCLWHVECGEGWIPWVEAGLSDIASRSLTRWNSMSRTHCNLAFARDEWGPL